MTNIAFQDIFLPNTINALLLGMFYAAFQLKWPELYFSTTDQISIYFSGAPRRFFAFRILPVVLMVTIVIGSYSSNLSWFEKIYLGSLLAATHGIITNGFSFIKILASASSVKINLNKITQLLLHLITVITFLVIVGPLAGFLSTTAFLKDIIPSFREMIDGLWSTLITALIAVFLYEKIYKRNDITKEDLFARSQNNIDPELIVFLKEESVRHNANPMLVEAVCIAENMQRPGWARGLEKAKSMIIRGGTYGIMQVQSPKYISDKESIMIGIQRFFKDTKNIFDETSLIERIKKYNGSRQYIDLVISVMSYLSPSYYPDVTPDDI